MVSSSIDIGKALETSLNNSERNVERLNNALLKIQETLENITKNGGSKEVQNYLANSFDLITDFLNTKNDFDQKSLETLKNIAGGRAYQADEAKIAAQLKLEIAEVVTSIEELKQAKDSINKHSQDAVNKLHALDAERNNPQTSQERVDELDKEIDSINEIINRDKTESHRLEIVIENHWKAIEKAIQDIKDKFGNGKDDSDIARILEGWGVLDLKNGIKPKDFNDAVEVNRKRREVEMINEKEISRLRREDYIAIQKRLRAIDALNTGIQKIWGQIKQGGNYWLRYNEQAISDAKRLGMSLKSAYAYQTAMMQTSKELARNFGMSADQAMKMQQSFFEATGKATILSKSQMEDVAAASKILGTESVASAIKIMDNMGSTAGEAVELIDRTYQRAANSGFDTVQMSKKFIENMSLANKLTFRSGVDGISRMTVLSERMKLNLQNVASVADKFSSIEGAINGSAQMQMLGGQYSASFGNPMAVLYESMSNPEALYKRMLKTFSTQAVFNKQTGEAEIDPYQMQLMKEAAKAMGINPDDAVSSAKAQVKNKEIDAVIARNFNLQGISEEEKTRLESMAQFNKETGLWNVTYSGLDGEKKSININSLSARDMKEIMRDNVDPVVDIKQHVRAIASELVGTKERWNSMKDQWKTGLSQTINKPMQWGSNLLSDINGSGTWGALTSDVLGQGVGLLGMGAFSAANAYFAMSSRNILRKLLSGGIGATNPNINPVSGNLGPTAPSAGVTPNPTNTGASPGGAGKWHNRFGAKLSKFGTNTTKVIKGLGAFSAIASGAYVGYQGYTAAEDNLNNEIANINKQEREGNINSLAARMKKIKAENEAHKAKSGAIGEGVGVAAGALGGMAIGAAIGGPIGAIAGLMLGGLGGFVGSPIGKAIGETIGEGGKSNGDTVANIDYTVSIISRQLGVIGSVLTNGAIVYDEQNGGFVKGDYISSNQVEIVNNAISCARVAPIDYEKQSSNISSNSPSSVSLNIDGTIKLDCGKFIADMPKDKLRDIIMKSGVLDEIVSQVSKGQQLAYSGCKTTTDTTGRPNVQYNMV